MDKMQYNQIDASMRTVIDQNVKGCNDAVQERVRYITQKYGKERFEKENLKEGKSLDAINSILQESREYRMMKQQDENQTDVTTYKNSLKLELEKSDLFTNLQTFSQQHPRAFYAIHQQLENYEGYLEFSADVTEIGKIKQNVEYFKKFFLYTTLGKLPSERLEYMTAEPMSYESLDTFFGEGKLLYQSITTEVLSEKVKEGSLVVYNERRVENDLHVSSVLGQNILYRIAKEVIGGYHGSASLHDLKLFFRESEKDRNGIYYDGKQRCMNKRINKWRWLSTAFPGSAVVVGNPLTDSIDLKFGKDTDLNDPKKIDMLSQAIQIQTNKKNDFY